MRQLLFALILSLVTTPTLAEPTEDRVPFITAPAPEEHLIDNKIYFFAHSMCQGCRSTFIYLSEYHPDLPIPITDMKYHHNLELYKQCVKKFNIKNSELRLPLICMGNHYIMGWDETSPRLFEQYLRDFKSEFSEPTDNQFIPQPDNQ